MKYILSQIYEIYFPRHLKGVRNSEAWIASKMYFIRQNIYRGVRSSEPSIRRKLYYICQNVKCKIIEGSEFLNGELQTKYTIHLPKYRLQNYLLVRNSNGRLQAKCTRCYDQLDQRLSCNLRA